MVSTRKFFAFLRRNVPNILTLSRILGACLVHSLMIGALYSFIAYKKIVWDPVLSKVTIYLLIYTQISDFLDGLLARLLKIVSEWGGLLDRYADKILNAPIFFWMIVFYVAILISDLSNILTYFVIASLLALTMLEVTLIKYAIRGSKLKLRIKSRWSGKIKMTLECISTSTWLIGFLMPGTFFGLDSSSQEGMEIILAILVLANIFAFSSAYGHYKDHAKELGL